MEYRFIYLGNTYRVNIESDKQSWLVSIGDKEPSRVEVICAIPNCLSFIMDDKTITAYVIERGDKKHIFINGESFAFELDKGRARRTPGVVVKEGESVVTSPMPGSLVKVLVSRGDKVEMGQTLAIVEAMKMENELKSPIKGIVKQVNFEEGNQIDALQPIIELTPI